jgi:chromosome segregation ATPase
MNDQIKQLKDSLVNVKPLKETVKGAIRNVQTMREKIDRRADVLEKEVNQFIDAYIRALEKYRHKIVDKIDTICNKKVKALKLQKIQLEQNLDDIFHSCRFTEELLAEGSAVEILHCKKDVQVNHSYSFLSVFLIVYWHVAIQVLSYSCFFTCSCT